MKFAIVEGSGVAFKRGDRIERIIDAESVEEAQYMACRFLSGDGLPTSSDRQHSSFFLVPVAESFYLCNTATLWEADRLKRILLGKQKA